MQMNNRNAMSVIDEVRRSVIGKDICIIKVMAAILAGGHILIEDIPGVGKTTLATAFSKAMELEEHRVQFTPDVMPADITGFSMYNRSDDSFTYKPGSIMCNLFLADEINRTSPKTQSALLQVMEENLVSVDGETYAVPEPFVVIATQNPVGSAGTQRLPLSQLDRFMICLSMGYPSIEDEINIVKGKNTRYVSKSVITRQELSEMKAQCEKIFVHDSVYSYIGRLIAATRQNGKLELGISPRGTISLTSMAKSMAFLKGREFVLPDDIADIFCDVTAHRVLLSSKSRMDNLSPIKIMQDILDSVTKPNLKK